MWQMFLFQIFNFHFTINLSLIIHEIIEFILKYYLNQIPKHNFYVNIDILYAARTTLSCLCICITEALLLRKMIQHLVGFLLHSLTTIMREIMEFDFRSLWLLRVSCSIFGLDINLFVGAFIGYVFITKIIY